MHLLDRFVNRIEFEDYEDFKANFRVEVPADFDFARDVVDAYAAAEPGKRALLYVSDADEAREFSFAEIADHSKRIAAYFKSMGIGAGDRVLTLMRRRWEYWATAVALHRLGAVVVPASIQLTTKDIAYRVNVANVKCICAIGAEFVLQQLSGIREKCPALREIVILDGEIPADCRSFKEYESFEPLEGYSGLGNHDQMLIYFTSGTSGQPKMAMHNRTYPLGHIVTAKYMQCVQEDGLHLTQADSGWAKFGWGNIYGQWICGSAILAYDPVRFHGEQMLQVMEEHKPTSLCVPPTMYRLLLRSGLEAKHVASVKWFSTAGEPLAAEINERFHAMTGSYIHEAYGQSEGTPISCTFPWVEVRPGSMGKPSPLYDTDIVRSDGTSCGVGVQGEVIIRVGDREQIGLLCAYGGGEDVESPLKDGIYHTGDIACRDAEGYYWYISRGDDIIKSSGYRIGPFEIESVLNTHPAVKESAIIGQPDEIRGQIVCAVIALHEGYEASEELTKDLQNYVKVNTAPYKYPRKVIYTESLPKTTSGKIIRKGILDLL